MQEDLLGCAVFTQGDQTSGFRPQPFLSSASGPVVYGAADPGLLFLLCLLVSTLTYVSLRNRKLYQGKRPFLGAFVPLFLPFLWTYLLITRLDSLFLFLILSLVVSFSTWLSSLTRLDDYTYTIYY